MPNGVDMNKETSIDNNSSIETGKGPEKKNIEDYSYLELQGSIIGEEDRDKKEALLEEHRGRIKELEDMGILKRKAAKDQITSIIVQSKWDKVYKNIVFFGGKMETSARQRYQEYEDPRYLGAVEQAYVITANQVIYEGLLAREDDFDDDGYDEYLNEKLNSVRGRVRLNNLKRSMEAKVFDFGEMELKSLVGTETSEHDLVYDELKYGRPETTTELNVERMAEAVEKGATRARERTREKERLSAEREYWDYLNAERWSETVYDFDKEENPFYVQMNRKEREFFNKRHLLHKATQYKREKAWSAKDMIANESLQKISKQDIIRFYKKEGVSQVLHEYVRLADNNKVPNDLVGNPLNEGSRDIATILKESKTYFLKCSDRSQIEVYRDYVYQKALNNLLDQNVSKEEAILKAREAEQIGYNLLLVTNTFESLDSQWKGDRKRKTISRTKKTSLNVAVSKDLWNKPIRTFLNPIDTVVELAERPREKEVGTGALSEWAEEQIRRSVGGWRYRLGLTKDLPEDFNGFDEIKIVESNPRSISSIAARLKNKYWKVEKKKKDGKTKYTLHMPEMYLHNQFTSYWENEEVAYYENGKEKKTPLIDYLRSGETVLEGWSGCGDFSSYMVNASYKERLWDLCQPNGGEIGKGDVYEWTRVVNQALGAIGKRDDEELKRWLLYAKYGVSKNKRLAKISQSPYSKNKIYQMMRNLKKDGEEFMKLKNIYFDWDWKGVNRGVRKLGSMIKDLIIGD
jgi:hypothetical protein